MDETRSNLTLYPIHFLTFMSIRDLPFRKGIRLSKKITKKAIKDTNRTRKAAV